MAIKPLGLSDTPWYIYEQKGFAMNVAILVRVSSESDRQDYDRQISDLSAIAKKNKWTVVKIIPAKYSIAKAHVLLAYPTGCPDQAARRLQLLEQKRPAFVPLWNGTGREKPASYLWSACESSAFV